MAASKSGRVDPKSANKAATMSLRAYSRHRGCSLASVQQAIDEGRITSARWEMKGKRKSWHIDPVAADAEWAANTGEKRGDAPKDATEVEKESLAAARLRREVANAEIAELAAEEKRGKLIDAEYAARKTRQLAQVTVEALLSIPDRVATRIAGELGQTEATVKVHAIMHAEIESSTRDLCEELERLGDD